MPPSFAKANSLLKDYAGLMEEINNKLFEMKFMAPQYFNKKNLLSLFQKLGN